MKQLLTLAAIIALAAVGYLFYQRMSTPQPVPRAGESKFICSIGGPDTIFTTEFATREECEKNCKGGAVVCEETGVTPPVTNTDS